MNGCSTKVSKNQLVWARCHFAGLVSGALCTTQSSGAPARPFLLMSQHKAPHRNWMPGPAHLRTYEDVEIPDAEDYRVPKEFREEVLDAMREGAPPRGYEEQVREYYRRLVE